jgi:hypothetical protein
MTPPIIGISGAFGTGKDEVAKILCERYGYQRRAFADALKEEVARCLYHDQQIPDDLPDEISELMYGYKGHPCKVWDKPTDCGMRRILQFWGTEWRRAQDGDYWVKALSDAPRPRFLVIPDVRFRNEAEWVRANGGQCWNVVRPCGFYEYEASAIKGHLSERDLAGYRFDRALLNSGTLEDLPNEVRCAMEIYRAARDSEAKPDANERHLATMGFCDWHSELREMREHRH